MKSSSEHIWTSGNGRKIAVSDMATSHIINSIKKIKRENWKVDWLPILTEELNRRNMLAGSSEDLNVITEKEMIYFLENACNYTCICGEKEIFPNIIPIPDKYLDQKMIDFLKKSFVLPDSMTNKDVLLLEMKQNLTDPCSNEDLFIEKYEGFLVENIFEQRWKGFIDLMLGR